MTKTVILVIFCLQHMVVLLQQITFPTIIFKLSPNVHLKIESHSNIYEDPNNWWSIGSKCVIENWPSGPISLSFLWFHLCLSYNNHISRAYQITWIFCVCMCTHVCTHLLFRETLYLQEHLYFSFPFLKQVEEQQKEMRVELT